MPPHTPPTAESTVRWNMAVNLLDISFFTFGLSLVSRETVVPLLVSQLTDSPIAIGVIPAVYSLSIYLPQLFGARIAGSMPLKKPYVAFWGTVGERLPYLLMGVVVLLLARPAPLAAFFLLVVLFGISAGTAGFVIPAWFDLISKVIPLERRGLFTGASHGFGALLGVAGAAVMALILERVAYPLSYALLFLLASVALTISLFGLLLTRESPSEGLHPPMPLRGFLRSLPEVLRRDRNFRRFITASAVVRLGTMAGGFFLVYGTRRFGIGGAEVGLLTGVLIGAQAVLNPVWGMLGDRRGHKTALVAGGLALGLAAAVAWLGPSWPWLVLAFGLLGASLATETASFLTILPEFCAEADRPMYIGLTNTLLAPISSLAPLIGGALAAALGYQPMFALAALVGVVGASLLALWVREPRHTPRPQAAAHPLGDGRA
jgi:MFS family permease